MSNDRVIMEVQFQDGVGQGSDPSLSENGSSADDTSQAEFLRDLRQLLADEGSDPTRADDLIDRPASVTAPEIVTPTNPETPEAPGPPPSIFEALAQQAQGVVPHMLTGAVTQATGSATAGATAGTLLGGSASALGPQGLAIIGGALIASEIVNAITEGFDRVVRGGADLLTNPNRRGAFQDMAQGSLETVTQLMDPLQALTGINLNPIDDMFRSLIRTVRVLDDNMMAFADNLAGVSADISMAQAEGELSLLEQNLRDSERLSGMLSQNLRLQNDLDVEQQRMVSTMTEIFGPLINTLKAELVDATKTGNTFLEVIAEELGLIGKENKETGDRGKTWTAWARDNVLPWIPQLGRLVEQRLRERENEEINLQEEIRDFFNPANTLQTVGFMPGLGVEAPGAKG